MKRVAWIVVTLCLAVAGGRLASTAYNQYWAELPSVEELARYEPPVATRVYDKDDGLVGAFFFERRYLTPIRDIPAVVRQAFVAGEDSEFYSHHGIDLISIMRAMVVNMRAGGIVQGGSTITQQVVKALLLSPERSYRRKIREVLLAIKLERALSKDEILYLYLNQIYLGDGNYGIGAAARSYFGKEPSALTLPEAALLAGLPQAPSRYSPTRNPEGATMRQRYVLARMREERLITETDYASALNTVVEVRPRTAARKRVGNYYTEYVRRYLEDNFGKQALYYGGFRVHTSMDMGLQSLAEAAVRRGAAAVDAQLGYLGPIDRMTPEALATRLAAEPDGPDTLRPREIYRAVVVAAADGRADVLIGPHSAMVTIADITWHPDIERTDRRLVPGDVIEVAADDRGGLTLTQSRHSEAALVALEPGSGAVRALVGGHDFSATEFDRATRAARQPGSAFKPLVYAAALDHGYTPASIVLDAPIQWVDHDSVWRPQNYSRRYYGPTTLRHALEKSRNVVTVRVVQDLGASAVVDYVSRFGFQRPIGRNLSVGLGTSETSLLELTSAYAVFADAGERVQPLLISRIEDASGRLVAKIEPTRERVMSEQTAYLITSMLEGVVQSGTGRVVRGLGRPVAGKTGTTNDQRDAWFIGFTPELVTGVWVGYDDERTLGPSGTGGRMAAPVWLEFMRGATAEHEISDFAMPDGIVCVNIDRETGQRASLESDNPYLECFKEGTEPARLSDPSDEPQSDQKDASELRASSPQGPSSPEPRPAVPGAAKRSSTVVTEDSRASRL